MENKELTTIRQLRTGLGLTSAQLGYKLGIAQSSVVRLEQSEVRGTASINSLRKAARVMGFDFVYSLVPQAAAADHRPARAARAGRRPSALGSQLEARDLLRAQKMSPADRLLRALELSDLTRALRNVPTSPRTSA